MTLHCRPRAGGDPYAAARPCGKASDDRNLGGYGSPPARGRRRPVSCQGQLSALNSALRWNELRAAILVITLALLIIPIEPVLAHGIGGKDASFVAATKGPDILPFMYLGAKHMVTGYDNLLFILDRKSTRL